MLDEEDEMTDSRAAAITAAVTAAGPTAVTSRSTPASISSNSQSVSTDINKREQGQSLQLPRSIIKQSGTNTQNGTPITTRCGRVINRPKRYQN